MSELLNFLTLDNLKQTTGLMRESPISISRRIKMPFRWLWGSGRYKAMWKVRLVLDILVKSHETRQGMCLPKHCWIQGRGPQGAAAPSLFLDQTTVRRVEKKFLETGLRAYLRVWMTRAPSLSQGLDPALPKAFWVPWADQASPNPACVVFSPGKSRLGRGRSKNAAYSKVLWTFLFASLSSQPSFAG